MPGSPRPQPAVLLAALLSLSGLAGCVLVSSDPNPVVREFTIEAAETQVELYDGMSVTMWTFNGIAPGPLIRVREGDRVIIHFYNNHTLPHNVHFHGAHAADMDGVAEVAPGGVYTYDFIAGPAGAYVYHCHVDTRIHIQKGLYGQFIVEPRHGFGDRPPATEHFAVFSDWNPNLNATSEAYILNGKSFPETVPFQIETGRTARFFISSMSMVAVAVHFHGVLSQQVWPNEQPIDIIHLAPGETRVIDYRNDFPGVWMFHDHFEDHLVNAENYPGGTLGLIQVGREHWTPATGGGGHGHAPPETTSAAAPAAGGMEVAAKDFKFAPGVLTVSAGTTVTWTNDDPTPHTVTSDQAGGPLDSGNFGRDASYSYTFSTPGTYTYHCVPHSGKSSDGSYAGMVGTIVVEPASPE